jgi:4-hydroxythreonine-4-phosphate dehydrogenase
MSNRPLLGISVGDPAGIGPEITAKALADPEIYRIARPLVVSDMKIMEQIIGICQLDLSLNAVVDPSKGRYEAGTLDVLDLQNVDPQKFSFNSIAAETGKASYENVAKVIELAMAGKIDATITGPIHKESLNQAGYHFAGHTEIYGALTGTKDFAMMLAEGNFRVAHVSTHVSLQEAIRRVKKERIFKVIELSHRILQRLGLEHPRIAVAGLNPHAGENGLFGHEEVDEIIPAIELAKSKGIQADGPHPPDTIFPKMKGGQYDLVVCMYHDQGHIPTKLLGFQYDAGTNRWSSMSGVNITLGLPILRVSVDHGVAFDKGGKNEANPESMIQAIHYGARLCQPLEARS